MFVGKAGTYPREEDLITPLGKAPALFTNWQSRLERLVRGQKIQPFRNLCKLRL